MKVKDKRQHRKIRIRKKVNGTASVPRLAVFKSNNNIYVQAIDDLNQVTIVSCYIFYLESGPCSHQTPH